jgi:hypothetical protein
VKKKLEDSDHRLTHVLEDLKKENLLSHDSISVLEGRFSEVQLDVVKSLVGKKKGKGNRFSSEAKDFAITLFYYSPNAYNFVSKLLNLPNPRSIRRYVGSIDCHPGFQIPAFQHLDSHKGDVNYSEASLCVDGMSIKELIQFDQKLGKCVGYVDLGGGSSTGEDVPANESLVVMAVGLRSYWKLPLAYFLIKGVSADILAGIIREALCKCYESGVNVRTVCMDGTIHNISAFNKLGCTMQPKELDKIVTKFPHPHEDCADSVFAFCDPPHMAKNVRNMLAEYKDFVWPGHGTVRWSHIVKLQRLQEEHGLRLANKLTPKHTAFHKNKMKVTLAVQLMSDSVSHSLKWAHANGVQGFEDDDVLTTCKFLELHDQLFDILNSRARYAFGIKAALSPGNLHQAEVVFQEFIGMYKVLERTDGLKVVNSRRRTGPLGFIACIITLRNLATLMESGEFAMDYLRCHKLQQDHLEHFFGAVRQRNGFSINPTAQQFRFAFRQLLCHAGKNIVHSATGNCIAQDETVLLQVSNYNSSCRIVATVETSDTTSTQFVLDENNNAVIEKPMHDKGCVAKDCLVCGAAIAYIAGYYVRSMQRVVKCVLCKFALIHSEEDPCVDSSLISFKDYCPDETDKGLMVPSGSLCKMLFLCEKVFRQNSTVLSSLDVERKLLIDVLTQLDMSTIFPSLKTHALETSDGVDNHYLTMVHLICRKYLRLRVKKVLRDMALKKSIVGKDGNAMHRSRIVQNV